MRNPGPKTHCVYRTNETSTGSVLYPYGPPEQPSTEPFRCSCGATGDGQAAAVAHLEEKAKAAWRRLSPMRAMAATLVGASSSDSDALHLLYLSRHWVDNPQIKKCIVPGYDPFGVLSGSMDWTALARELAAGQLDGYETDRIVLRVDNSLAGVDAALKLSELWRLGGQDARHVREALIKQLPIDDT